MNMKKGKRRGKRQIKTQHKFTCPHCNYVGQVIIVLQPEKGDHQCPQCNAIWIYTWKLADQHHKIKNVRITKAGKGEKKNAKKKTKKKRA